MNREAKLEKALEELLGFARRNEERAHKAVDAATKAFNEALFIDGELSKACYEAEARHHEAARFYQVVRLRVEEAFHAG